MKKYLHEVIAWISVHWNLNLYKETLNKCKVLRSQYIAGKLAEAWKGCLFHSVAQLHDPQFIHIGNNNSFGRDLYLTAWGGVQSMPSSDHWKTS